jgi:hypothetical protein
VKKLIIIACVILVAFAGSSFGFDDSTSSPKELGKIIRGQEPEWQDSTLTIFARGEKTWEVVPPSEDYLTIKVAGQELRVYLDGRVERLEWADLTTEPGLLNESALVFRELSPILKVKGVMSAMEKECRERLWEITMRPCIERGLSVEECLPCLMMTLDRMEKKK